MLVPRCGVPRFLLILLGPMLFAAGWATAESQGEERAGLLWPPAAAAAIIRNILWVEKWPLKQYKKYKLFALGQLWDGLFVLPIFWCGQRNALAAENPLSH